MTSSHVAALLLIGETFAPDLANAQANVMGQWSSPFYVREGATHSVLLRGQGDSTLALYWDNGTGARVWLWNQANPTASLHVAAPELAAGLFEPGQTVLADGRAFSPGGSYVELRTSRDAFTFDAKRYWQPGSYGWQRQDSMATVRLSPTAVPLPDGSVLVHSGIEYHSLATFGGNDGAGPLGELRELTSSRYPRWPARPNASPPDAREDASLNFVFNRLVLYGGLGVGGPLGDLHSLRRIQDDVGVRWEWGELPLVAGSPVPPARSKHAAVARLAACDSLCDTLYVFGGLGTTGARGDVWRLLSGNYAQRRYRWEQVSTAGAGPGPRYGHSAVFDPGPPGSVTPRMLVFGGRDSLGQLADNAVWSLALRDPFRWSVAAPAGGGPPARAEHRAHFDARVRFPASAPQRMVVYGGEGGAGTLGDAWSLQRNHSNVADTVYSWLPFALNTAPPPARSRHAIAYDNERDQLVVFGGDGNGATPGGLLNDTWALTLFNGPSLPGSWRLLAPDSIPSARAGLPMAWWPLGAVTAEVPERFDPTAPTGSQWRRLDWAQRYDQWSYPYLMLTDRGRVFYAGINDSCNSLDPDSTSATRGWGPKFGTGFSGAAAVEVRPNVFLKSGGDQQPGATGYISFDTTGATTGWQIIPGMLPRLDHSLITLPTGDVLVLGGVAQRRNQALAQREPQLFSFAARSWSGPLAPSPNIREYHHSSLLLPDARIISWGSVGGLSPRDSAEIYSPAYLFSDAAGTLAPRPVITAVQDTLAYGQSFALCACAAPRINSASLIRPGAATHAFDANARFVPLTFAPDPSGTVFFMNAPANANLAPPGDYLLFVVDSAGVPAVAKWVHIRPGADVPGPGCPLPCATDVDPRPSAMLALAKPRPNPFFATSRLEFTLPVAGRARFEVLDLQGRRMRLLMDRMVEAGRHAQMWDGRSDTGTRVAPGVYFVRLTVGGDERVQRLVRLP